MLRKLLPGLLLGLLLQPVWAEDKAPASGDYVSYIELKPFITNFSGDKNGPLRFVKCEITVQVGSPEAQNAVNYHLPDIRDDLVFLLSEQTEDQLATVAAQQTLANKALKEVQGIMQREEGKSYVTDLFFTSLVIQ